MIKIGSRLAAIALLAGAFSVPAAGQKLASSAAFILRETGRAGGDLLAANNMTLESTIGDVGPDSFSSAGSNLQSGFAPMSSQPGSVVSITTMTKSTDTLLLSWQAPGRDGFAAKVSNGWYRVDYSSDASHIFAPTTFVTEFSTSVNPGDAQSIRLTGLLPNTTYYAKIYLADERKFFAEDSVMSRQSTLSNVPVAPVITFVSDSSVTITWNLPAGAAEGFQLDASSTNFGGLTPGGIAVSSSTNNGVSVTLTIGNLLPLTTYFFRVGALNWQGDDNYTVLLGTLTRPSSGPLPVTNLMAFASPLTRTISLTWSNPVFQNSKGVLVLVSTSATTSQVTTGRSFSVGQVLADSATVEATAWASAFSQSQLTLDTTYFYHVFTFNSALDYSVRVTTATLLDLPPLAAAGFSSSMDATATHFTINWHSCISNADGSLFVHPQNPSPMELDHYEISRSTSVIGANWVLIATVPVSALTYTDALPNPNQTYLYKIEPVDAFHGRDTAMGIDTNGDLYIFGPDGVTHMRIPKELVKQMLVDNNARADMLVKSSAVPPDAQDRAFNGVRFDVKAAPDLAPESQFQFQRGSIDVAMHYDIDAAGHVVPTGMRAAGLVPFESPDPRNLGMYWYNGGKWVKLFGNVDVLGQTVTVQTAMGGPYQTRELARTSGFHFDISQISNKVITPNGDGLNDVVVFNFDNPLDSSFSGKIFDTRGAYIADMASGPIPNTLQWDGRANGRYVHGGVYIYRVSAEDHNWSGTVVVVR